MTQGTPSDPLDRIAPHPEAAKVPEIIAVFWLIKVLTTGAGETGSDQLAHYGNVVGGGIELLLLAVGLVAQFSTRRYRAAAYWLLAYAIAVFGTGVADFLHLDVKIPYAGTSILWAAALIGVFVAWYRSEGTLSIHSITTRRRECFYWTTVFVTFGLGTAVGDYTAIALKLGYLESGVLFLVAIAVPLLAWRLLRLDPVVAFWSAYVLTRPLGASFADYLSKGRRMSGLGFGDGATVVGLTLAVVVLVAYLAIARPDIQRPAEDARSAPTVSARV